MASVVAFSSTRVYQSQPLRQKCEMGEIIKVNSNKNWKVTRASAWDTNTKYRQNDHTIGMQELYDARLAKTGWKKSSFHRLNINFIIRWMKDTTIKTLELPWRSGIGYLDRFIIRRISII